MRSKMFYGVSCAICLAVIVIGILLVGYCPGILECHRTVEYQMVFSRVRIHGKIPVSHELEGLARLCAFQGLLQLAAGENNEGIGV